MYFGLAAALAAWYNKRRRLAAIQQNSDMDGRIAGYEG